MRLHRFSATQVLPVGLDSAWAFFSNPRNLQLMTPPSLNLVPTCEIPDEMHAGLIITYKVKPAPGISVNWVTEITHVVDRKFFVDEQRSGPYRFWHHQHHFRAVAGGTEARDVLHYALPLGLVGEIGGAALVNKRVTGIFEYRRRALEQRFGALRQPAESGRANAGPATVLGLT
ncbi:MAG: SRPBCC family protein [Tepidiformaceae bacterium]